MFRFRKIFWPLSLSLLAAQPAHAADIRLRANLAGSCILSLSTEGRLALSGDTTILGSEESTGAAATMTVVAIGGTPMVSFTAPALDAPAGMPGGATVAIRYTSLGGSNQAYTSNASSSSAVRLLDTFTIHGKVTSSAGFASGAYLVQTVATCQQ